MQSLAANVAAVRAEIAAACVRAGRDPAQVRLIAVTKEREPDVLPALLAAGVLDVGENRVEHHAMMRAAAPAGLRFHAIGRIQGRQLVKLAPISDCLHSLCDPGHVPRLAQAVAQREGGSSFPVFIQVNTSGETSKAGVVPADLPRLLDLVRAQPSLAVVGLMTMAPLDVEVTGDAIGRVRRCFADLRELTSRHGLPRLSMGMSQDFPIAIEEGATDVRIGTRLFSA
jgi:pyridoxal phosphate enzyme (YggS family)